MTRRAANGFHCGERPLERRAPANAAPHNLILAKRQSGRRPGRWDICYRAFKAISDQHGFSPDFPDTESAAGLLSMLIGHNGFFDIVAEVDGKIVGSNFLDARNLIARVGPLTVDPALQNDSVGRALMQLAMEHSAERRFAGIRLVQAAHHRRSLALYVRLGFEVRELLACLRARGRTRRRHCSRCSACRGAQRTNYGLCHPYRLFRPCGRRNQR
ncbi:MAG: GNAT family N-acetyltransferase [Proteobacteria bacterium]|nr:GNAT family N-acetyltransferase [Pseudomonadota bacterium]